MLFHTLAFCCRKNFWRLLQWSEWYGATGENRNFENKEDKATTQILNLNTKTTENKRFIHYGTSNDFRPFVFVMPKSKRKYQCFLILVQSFSACTFSRHHAVISPIQTFIGLVINFSFKWPRQEAKTKQQQNKTTFTATKSQECSPTNRHQPTNCFWRVVTGTLRWLASLHCVLYFLTFDWLRPPVVFFLNWTVCLFVKESPIWNHPN